MRPNETLYVSINNLKIQLENNNKRRIMENILNIPKITNNTIQYFVDDKLVDNVTVDQVNQIRENVINYIIENKDKSILDKFYFVGHRDSNDKPGEEIKITMDIWGNFSNLPWEMNHVRRSMMRLMQIGRKNCELLNSLNNGNKSK